MSRALQAPTLPPMKPSIAILSRRRPGKLKARANWSRRSPRPANGFARVRCNLCTARKPRWRPGRTSTSRSIAGSAGRLAGSWPGARARVLPLRAWRASISAIRARAREAANGTNCIPACVQTLPPLARGPTGARDRAELSFHPDVASRHPVGCFLAASSSRTPDGQRAQTFERLPQLMPSAQQNDTHKGTPHAELIGNFVVAHVRVVAHNERHASAGRQFVQRLAHFLARAFFDQLLELIRIGVFERQRVQILGFFILTDFAAAKQIPAMVRGDFVEPRSERPRRIVLVQFVVHFHKNFHGGIFRILPRGKRPTTETENRRGIFTIEVTPGLLVPCPGPGYSLRRISCSRRAHPAWSRCFHILVRSQSRKNYTEEWPEWPELYHDGG